MGFVFDASMVRLQEMYYDEDESDYTLYFVGPKIWVDEVGEEYDCCLISVNYPDCDYLDTSLASVMISPCEFKEDGCVYAFSWRDLDMPASHVESLLCHSDIRNKYVEVEYD